MRANRELREVHAKGPGGLAAIGDRDRVDQLEIVEIATGESVLHWDVRAGDLKPMLRALRHDMAQLETEDFLARWAGIEGPADLGR
jgi:hypothetical protein